MIRQVRKKTLTPIIVLSARTTEQDKSRRWIWEPTITLPNPLAPGS